MLFIKKTTYRKRAKRSFRKRRSTRGSNGVPERASMTVKFTARNGDSTLFSSNQLYRNTSIALVDLGERAASVAQAYAKFRIKKVTATWKPLADTYSATASSDQPIASSKPNLYYMLDKSDSIPPNVTLEGLKAMGAKPRALDEKPISVSWKPTVILGDVSSSAAQVKITPYLPTFESTLLNDTSHHGIYWYVEQSVSRQGIGYCVEFTVELEFLKPLVSNMTGDTVAIDAVPALRDTSSNGIVDDIA